MAFFQCCESSPFKAFTEEWGSSTSIEKHMKDSHLLQPLLDFLAFVEEFFHPPPLVFIWNHLF
jgi:hypothetical protein